VLVYYHGGGFIVGSFASPEFHTACLRLAAELPPPLVAAGDHDIREYVARMQAAGNNKRVDLVEFPGAGHGFAIFEPDGKAAGELVRGVRRFLHGRDAAQRMSGSALGAGLLVQTHLVTLPRCSPAQCTRFRHVTSFVWCNAHECYLRPCM
jgi:acetyl esterase/lipase